MRVKGQLVLLELDFGGASWLLWAWLQVTVEQFISFSNRRYVLEAREIGPEPTGRPDAPRTGPCFTTILSSDLCCPLCSLLTDTMPSPMRTTLTAIWAALHTTQYGLAITGLNGIQDAVTCSIPTYRPVERTGWLRPCILMSVSPSEK